MIAEFQGQWRFLSNFYPAEVIGPQGLLYPTVEHAFQAAKTADPKHQQFIQQQSTPGKAKREGRKVALREEWETIKLSVMFELVMRKFETHEKLGAKLLATGYQELVEGNYWNDTYWGVCKGKGENNLGKILMEVRAVLQSRALAVASSARDNDGKEVRLPPDIGDFKLRVGIVGSREYPRLDLVSQLLNKIVEKHGVKDVLIVSGGARGVDQHAENEARRHGFTVLSFRPTQEWKHINKNLTFSNKAVIIVPGEDFDHEYWNYKNNERYTEFMATFKDAAFSRNEDIVKNSDVVCAFPLNRPGGTTNTINHAKRYLARGDIRALRIFECNTQGTLFSTPKFH